MSRGRFVTLSIALDAVFVNACFVGSFFLWFGGRLPQFNYSAYVGLWPLITAVYLVAGYIYGLYEPERTEGSWALTRAVLQAATLGIVLTAAAAFFLGPRFFSFSRAVILIAWLFQLVTLVGWRLVVLRLTPIRWPDQHVLIVGTGDLAVELAAEFVRRAEWGFHVVGFLERAGDAALPSDVAARHPVLGSVADAARVVAAQHIDRVIIASPTALREVVEELALSDEAEVRVEVIPELYEILIGTVDSTVSDIPLMQLTHTTVPGWFVALKRGLDVVIGLFALVVLSPAFLLVSAAILLSMGWPVFFTQSRVGKNLREFAIVKFRTMVRDAEAVSGPVLAEQDDTRITPLGGFLRRYRLDEIPQLINIVLGDMSFVGPRPERPFFVDQYLQDIPGYRERFRVKPGVTGLAQVSGTYATTPERKLKYDLIYLYHQNLLMDVQILVETVRVVLTGRGAR
ncbi:MAG: sugar transferase [Actinomycetia bacterium]|nr:sugar transferase [Actinomycetes bacterium]